MTTEPWFDALRQRKNQDFDGEAHLTNEELDALLDIAEAAQECWRQVVPNGNDRFQVAAHDRLRDALLRASNRQPGGPQ